MWILRWVFGSLILLVIVGFALQNTEQQVSIRFLTWETPNLPLWVFLYAAFAFGVLTWLLLSISRFLSLQAEVRRAQREAKRLREELDRLRNLAIEEEEPEEGPAGV
ncbi:MAG: LapA family protein [candidate division KSB1 bacterium]|nr:LapA family protein [candidate division KSB1 bacterium]